FSTKLIPDDELNLKSLKQLIMSFIEINEYVKSVMISFKENSNFEFDEVIYNVDLEYLSIKVKQMNTKPFVVTVIYNPQQSELFLDNFQSLLDMTSLYEHLILGDMNYDLLKPGDIKKILRLTKDKGFVQLINEPTRITYTTESLIDHIYTNRNDMISTSGVIKLDISDHFAVFVCRKKPKPSTNPTIMEIKNWNKLDKNILYEKLRKIDFCDLYSSENYNSNAFATELTERLSNFFHSQLKITKIRVRNEQKPGWLTSEIISLIQKRNNLYRAYLNSNKEKCSRNEKLHQEYKELRNFIVDKIKKSKKEFLSKKIETNLNCPKKVWKSLKEIIPTKKSNNVCIDKIDLNAFNKHFSKSEINCENEMIDIYNDEDGFKFQIIDEKDIIESLSQISNSNCVGPDGLTREMINFALPIILPHITALFNLIIDSNTYPEIWKVARLK
ncbi:RNA-directed DNA polymerase from mobile element jockey-like protein, partial [Dinothrombium tinctorium]